jgi:hypothetical protein
MLIREQPLFSVPLSSTVLYLGPLHGYALIQTSLVNTSPTTFLSQRILLLTPSQRESFFALSYIPPLMDSSSTSPSDGQIALSIFQTNAIAAGNAVGIFPRTARLNHGCSSAFNSVYSWREGEGVLVVHALRHIRRDEVGVRLSTYRGINYFLTYASTQELLTAYMDTKRPRSERQCVLPFHLISHASHVS